MNFCWNERGVGSLLMTRAPVRVSCHPVTPIRAASTGNGTRSSLATSRCLVGVITAVCQIGQVSPNCVTHWRVAATRNRCNETRGLTELLLGAFRVHCHNQQVPFETGGSPMGFIARVAGVLVGASALLTTAGGIS